MLKSTASKCCKLSTRIQTVSCRCTKREVLSKDYNVIAVTMSSHEIIDSHIHLWPEETSHEQAHTWMTPGMPLAKPHLLGNYRSAAETNAAANGNTRIKGVVYIETDVWYDSPSADLATWAEGPLAEILFLRKVVEGRYGERDSKFLLGLVPWAPMHQPPAVLEEYLSLAKDMAGPEAWPRVKGFRFLLQGLIDRKQFETVVLSDDFHNNLRLLGHRGFSFDVGVDQRSGGSWQLDCIDQAMKRAHANVSDDKKVIFILNHLCKPNFSGRGEAYEQWCIAVKSMSHCSNVYMKLSGAFSELPPLPETPADIAEHIRPWVTFALKHLGPRRLMFGSDWPVCNVKGPTGERSWRAWKDVVQGILDDKKYGLCDEDRERIWKGTASEAYRLY